MGKTWVICIDGTWNQPGQTDKDPVSATEESRPSNVAKTWQAVADTPLATDFYYGAIAPLKTRVVHTDFQGEAIYLNGIGTTGTIHRFIEGATGTGTSERIRDAIAFSRSVTKTAIAFSGSALAAARLPFEAWPD